MKGTDFHLGIKMVTKHNDPVLGDEAYSKNYVKQKRYLDRMGGKIPPFRSKYENSILNRNSAYQIKFNYGLEPEEYEKMWNKQEEKCAICGRKSKKLLSVDHDHDTGKVRALLCNACNLGLGNFREDKNILRKAIEYLERF